MEFLGADMTEWTPMSAMIVGVVLILAWSMFGGRGE